MSDDLELNLIIVPNQTSQLMERIDQSVVDLYGTIIGPTGLFEMEAECCQLSLKVGCANCVAIVPQ